MTRERAREIFLQAFGNIKCFDRDEVTEDFLKSIDQIIDYVNDYAEMRIRANGFIAGYFAGDRRQSEKSNRHLDILSKELKR